jgi:ATP-dependent DNA ligase
MGLEGIVSKRAKAAYIGGRTRAWLKIKSYQVSELEVAGVLAERGKPTMALMVDRQNNYLGGAFITKPQDQGTAVGASANEGRPATQRHKCQTRCTVASARRHGNDKASARRRGSAACQRTRSDPRIAVAGKQEQ